MKVFSARYNYSHHCEPEIRAYVVVANTKEEALGFLLEEEPTLKDKWVLYEIDESKTGAHYIEGYN